MDHRPVGRGICDDERKAFAAQPLPMKHLWSIILISLIISLGLIGPILWRYRREVRRTWGEAFGLSRFDDAPGRVQDDMPIQWRTAALLWIICISIVFLLGLAVSNGGGVVWVICAAGICALILLFNVVLLARAK